MTVATIRNPLIGINRAVADRAAAAEYALRRRASELEVIRLSIRVRELMAYVQRIALGESKVAPRTAIRLRAAEMALRKILPDLQQVEYRGVMAFAPISARQAALANLSDEQLETAIKVADMLKAAEPEPIDVTSERILEEESATTTLGHVAEPSREDSGALVVAGSGKPGRAPAKRKRPRRKGTKA